MFAFTPLWPADMNMEADRHFGETATPEIPLVRFYTWEKPAISFGRNQNAERRLDLERCRLNGIPVVKRPTGGRELLHGHDICYCVIRPFPSGITGVDARKLFSEINDVLVMALKTLGIDAEWGKFENRPRTIDGPCFVQTDSGEITVGGKKLVAAAQRVYPGCIIQQGSMPLARPQVDMVDYLRYGDRVAMRRKFENSTTYMQDHVQERIQMPRIVDAFKRSFESAHGVGARPGAELFDEFARNILSSSWYSD